MKKMKKVLAALLTATMTLSMGFTAAAATDYDALLGKNASFTKQYTINNGTAPAETFTFEFSNGTYVDNHGNPDTTVTPPEIADVTVNWGSDFVLAEGTTDVYKATVSVKLDELFEDAPLGVYTYEMTEVNNKVAGVSYLEGKLQLVVTVLYNETEKKNHVGVIYYKDASGNKISVVENSYDAGSLEVKKVIDGNVADMKKEFDFTIVFSAPTGETVNSTITVTKPDSTTEDIAFNGASSYTYNVQLGHENTVKFENIPEGVTYTVTEDNDGYAVKINDVEVEGEAITSTGNIAANDEVKYVYTNILGATVDTGISLDSMPYILVLALAVLGLAGFVFKKRSAEF